MLFSRTTVSTSSVSPIADALAVTAVTTPKAGNVVASCLTGISGCLARYW